MKDPHAAELGRRGGKKGGVARAKKMSASERHRRAANAARARWGHDPIPKPKTRRELKREHVAGIIRKTLADEQERHWVSDNLLRFILGELEAP